MPDRLTIAMYRAGPLLVAAAFASIAVAWTGHDLSGWPWVVVGLALVGTYWIGTRRVLRYGPAMDFELVVRSVGWTADRFTVRWRDTDAGRKKLADVTAHAESIGYRMEGEPRERRGWLTCSVDATFVKAPPDVPSATTGGDAARRGLPTTG
jgi:hypothetical protein